MSDVEQNFQLRAEPPQSIARASVDDKGRLKLPTDFQAYMESTGTTRFFITTLDLRQARIYPMELWKQNLRLMESMKEHSAASERLAIIAKAHGDEAEIKGGRVLLPAPLREKLGLNEKQPVFLDVYKGRINVVTQEMHEERMRLAEQSMAADLALLEAEGLQ